MSTALQSLIEMGFPQHKAERALEATGNQGVQRAMDWILSHPDDEEVESVKEEVGGAAQADQATSHTPATAEPPPAQPKSLKCEDCGKLLRSELDAQAHAARTQHQNFSESTEEIKPLTPEEKAAQLKKLEEKMKQRRKEREEQEKKDAINREKVRRKGGKDVTDLKQKMELKEAKKIAEERKREKQEDRLAKQRIREQIARDRAEHKARLEKEKQAAASPQQPGQSAAGQSAPATTAKKEYSSCRLQIRLLGGGALVQEFAVTATLVDVQRFIDSQNATGGGEGYSLMTSFPKHIFTPEESTKTLQQLGLVPSSVLIQTKAAF